MSDSSGNHSLHTNKWTWFHGSAAFSLARLVDRDRFLLPMLAARAHLTRSAVEEHRTSDPDLYARHAEYLRSLLLLLLPLLLLLLGPGPGPWAWD